MVAASPAWFATLEQRLQEFYVMPPHGEGDLLLRVQAPDRLWEFFVSMRPENLVIELLHPDIEDVEVQATLAVKEEAMLQTLDQPEGFDPRTSYFERNTIVAGDMALIQFFAQLLKRPTPYDCAVLAHVSNHPNQPETVLEADEFDPELMLELVVANQPICLRQVCDWPAVHWTVDEFKQALGHVVLRFNAKTQQEETLGDLLDQMHVMDEQRVYSAGRGLPEGTAATHFPVPPPLAEVLTGGANIWLGKSQAGRLLSRLHLNTHAIVWTQVWGKKTVYLYPPQDGQHLGPMQAFCGYQPFAFNPLAADFQRHPQAQNLGHLQLTLEPGDALLVPPAWVYGEEVDGWTWAISHAVSLPDALQWLKASEQKQ